MGAAMALGSWRGGYRFPGLRLQHPVYDPGAGSQEEHRDPMGGIHSAELSQQGSGLSRDQVSLGEGASWVLPHPCVPGYVLVNPHHPQDLTLMPLESFTDT